MKYLKIALFFVFVGTGAFLYVNFSASAKAPQRQQISEAATNVELMEVKLTDFTPRIEGYGYVNPSHTWNLVPRVSGRVVFINPNLKIGSVIDSGSTLLKIDIKEFELVRKNIQASIETNQIELKQLNVEKVNLEEDLKLQEEYLTLVQKDLDRQTELLQNGSISKAVYESTMLNVINARSKIQSIRNNLALIPVKISLNESKRVNLEVQLEQVELNMSYCEVKLPFKSRVISKAFEFDEYVKAGSVLAEFDDIAEAEILASFPVEEVDGLLAGLADDRISLDIKARIQVEASGRKFTWDAQFDRTDSSVDVKTRTMRVFLTVEDPYGLREPSERPPLVRSMFCRVELEGVKKTGRIVVPRLSVHEGKVYLCVDNRLKIRDVEVERFQGNQALLSGGLNTGEKLIVSRLVSAISGMLLNDVNAPKAKKDMAVENAGNGPQGSVNTTENPKN